MTSASRVHFLRHTRFNHISKEGNPSCSGKRPTLCERSPGGELPVLGVVAANANDFDLSLPIAPTAAAARHAEAS